MSGSPEPSGATPSGGLTIGVEGTSIGMPALGRDWFAALSAGSWVPVVYESSAAELTAVSGDGATLSLAAGDAGAWSVEGAAGWFVVAAGPASGLPVVLLTAGAVVSPPFASTPTSSVAATSATRATSQGRALGRWFAVSI